MKNSSNSPLIELATGVTAGVLAPMGQLPFEVRLLSVVGVALFFYRLQYNVGSALRTSIGFAPAYFLSGQLWIYNSLLLQNDQINTYGLPVLVTIFVLPAVLIVVMTSVYLLSRKRLNIGHFTLSNCMFFSCFWVLFEFIYSFIPDSVPLLISGYAVLGKLWDQVIPVVGVLGCSFLLVFCSSLAVCIVHHICTANRPPLYRLIPTLLISLLFPSLLPHENWTHPYDARIFHYQMVVNKNVDAPDNFAIRYADPLPKLIISGGVQADIERPHLLQQLQSIENNSVIAFLILMPRTESASDIFCSLGEGEGCLKKNHDDGFFPDKSVYCRPSDLSAQKPHLYRRHPSVDSYRLLILDNLDDAHPFLAAENVSGSEITVVFDIPNKGQVIRERLLHADRARALETGRPILRYSNVGISAAIDHKGTIVSRFLPEQIRANGQLRPMTGRTPMMLVGRYGVLGLITVILLFFCCRRMLQMM